jgi:hydrogenase nickel incorporation protein HypA/HybF
MHEAAIAAGILELAAAQAAGRPVAAVGVRLGEFTGVVREALEFAFEALTGGGVRLEIEMVPLAASCPECGWSGVPVREFCFICPQCAAPADVSAGREKQVAWIDLAEEPVCAS